MAMNLLELFGIPKDEPKKQEKKERKGSESGKKSSVSKETAEGIKLPVSINIKGFGTKSITDEMFGKSEVTEEDIKSYLYKELRAYPPSMTVLTKENKDYKVSLKDQFVVKGALEVNESTSFVLWNEIYNPEGLQIENGTIKTEELTAKIKEAFPVLDAEGITFDYAHGKEENSIITKVNGGEVKFLPLEDASLVFPSFERVEVSAELLRELIADENSEDSEATSENNVDMAAETEDENEKETENEASEEESSSNKAKQTAGEVPAEKVMKSVISHYNSDMHLIRTAEDRVYMVVPDCIDKAVAVSSSKASEDLYDVDGVTLSLLFTQYTLTKEDFGGKEKVKKDAIKKYVISKGHREFEFNDCILKYSEKLKLLIITLKGSTKGAKEGDEHPLFSIKNSCFQWKAPKVPWSVFLEGHRICEYIYVNLGTEVLMDLYYNPKTGKYHWYVPYQNVRQGSVSAVFEPFLQSASLCGLIKVGQFHSHGRFPAFFSTIDNMDEHVPGIYGVWGYFTKRHFFEEIIDDKNLFTMRYVQSWERGSLDIFDVFAERNIKEEQAVYEDLHKSAYEVSSWMEKVSTLPGNGKYYIEYVNGNRCATIRCWKEAEFLMQCEHLYVQRIKQRGSSYYVVPEGEKAVGASRGLFLVSTAPITEEVELEDESTGEYDTLFSLFM